MCLGLEYRTAWDEGGVWTGGRGEVELRHCGGLGGGERGRWRCAYYYSTTTAGLGCSGVMHVYTLLCKLVRLVRAAAVDLLYTNKENVIGTLQSGPRTSVLVPSLCYD